MKTVLTSSVILKENRRVVLLRRSTGHWPNHWCLPGGRVEPGESFEETAIRELWEEVRYPVGKEPLVLLGTTHTVREDVDYLGVVFLLAATNLKRCTNAEPQKHSRMEFRQQAKPPAKLLPSLAQFIERYPNLWRADRDIYENLRACQSKNKAQAFKKYGVLVEKA